jgi:LytS/YehU family sensor histidine kinase
VNRNDKRAANEYLRVFADLVRQNMHNVSKELIPLQKEMDLVSNYLKLEKLRFKEMLNYVINVQEDLDLSDIMIPPLLVQPLVENSIKHGILPLESVEGQIRIDIYRKDNTLYLEVRDNGIGIVESQKKPRTSHESFGLENIRKRIEQLGMIQNKEIQFLIEEAHDASGNREWTVATITMPIEDEVTV